MADTALETTSTPPTAVDAEVTAIGKVNEALAPLEPAVQQRVLRWAADRFNVSLSQTKTRTQGDDGHKRQHSEDNVGPEAPSIFNDFASLYDAANPTTEADKALVAGYWLQVIQSTAEWSGFSANAELRNLGHGVENITIALGALIDSTPRLVMQTHKAGKTKQARKKYNLTNEGIRRIKQMLTEGSANGG
jgi:hypothetical protein